MIWPDTTDNYKLNALMGLPTLLYWISLNGYFLYSHEYDKVPITMINSSRTVLQGFIGILPLCLGVAVFVNTQFYSMY